jgi:MFS family permease
MNQPGDTSRRQFTLLREQRFAPFFLTQLLGALNDNLFKIAFTSLVTYHASRFAGVDAASAAFMISAIFILPFVLFSATSGQIADKLDRARLMRLVKVLEVCIMLVGLAGFWFYSAPLLYVVTFLMGLHSTLFGPAKYAYLPQHLSQAELVGGNALVQMATFLAILVGTIAGGEMARLAADRAWVIGLVCLAVALLGLVASRRIPATPAPVPALRINWNPFTETWRNLALARSNRTVLMGMMGISWLWFLGATFLASFFNFSREVLFAGQGVLTLLLTMFSLGIGLGALLCERFSGGRLELALVPLGSLGMTVFALDLFLASNSLPALTHLQSMPEFLARPTHWRILADLWLLSLFAGFYSVPLYALIQTRCQPTHRARIIAANNILNALFMVLSAVMAMVLLGAGLTISQLYGVTALLNVAMAGLLFTLVPEFMTRFLAWSRLRKEI